jgi:hypothetical protein
MNKLFIFIFFIIIGILLYYFNTIDSFSIGNQFALERPIHKLINFVKLCINKGQICDMNEFGECRQLMHKMGGSCQINSIVGFFDALDIVDPKFSDEEREYINSFGIELTRAEYLNDVYQCLINKESMRGLLTAERLDPQRLVLNHAGAWAAGDRRIKSTRASIQKTLRDPWTAAENISDTKLDKIYLLSFEIFEKDILDEIWLQSLLDDASAAAAGTQVSINPYGEGPYLIEKKDPDNTLVRRKLKKMGHMSLMYRTNYTTLKEFKIRVDRMRPNDFNWIGPPPETWQEANEQINRRRRDGSAPEENEKNHKIYNRYRNMLISLRLSVIELELYIPSHGQSGTIGESLDTLKNLGVVCIFIDLCNQFIFAVTELDYPQTHNINLDSSDYIGSDYNNYQTMYNRYWKLKIIYRWMYMLGYNKIIHDSSELDLKKPLDATNEAVELAKWTDGASGNLIERDDVDKRFKALNALTYIYNLTFEPLPGDSQPTIAPIESCYGKRDRICHSRDSTRGSGWSRCDNIISSQGTLKCVIDEYRGDICLYDIPIERENRPISLNTLPSILAISFQLPNLSIKGSMDVGTWHTFPDFPRGTARNQFEDTYTSYYEYNERFDLVYLAESVRLRGRGVYTPVFENIHEKSPTFDELQNLHSIQTTLNRLPSILIGEKGCLIYLGEFYKTGPGILDVMWYPREFFLVIRGASQPGIYLMYGEHTGARSAMEIEIKGFIKVNDSPTFASSGNFSGNQTANKTTIFLDTTMGNSREYIILRSADSDKIHRLNYVLGYVNNIWNKKDEAKCSSSGPGPDIDYSIEVGPEPEPEPEIDDSVEGGPEFQRWRCSQYGNDYDRCIRAECRYNHNTGECYP